MIGSESDSPKAADPSPPSERHQFFYSYSITSHLGTSATEATDGKFLKQLWSFVWSKSRSAWITGLDGAPTDSTTFTPRRPRPWSLDFPLTLLARSSFLSQNREIRSVLER
jgi:hypothetical protein